MTLDINPIPKGHLVAITTGRYSDKDIVGVFRALEDIDVAVQLAAFKATSSSTLEEVIVRVQSLIKLETSPPTRRGKVVWP